MRLILASSNPHKAKEIAQILQDPSIEVLTMQEAGVESDPEENGKTFMENAVIKSMACAEKLMDKDENTVVISDDSGLVIDALDGEPGVHSARYLGYDTPYDVKNTAILESLKDVPVEKKTARFVCAAAAVLADGSVVEAEEVMEGRIADSIAGENGFGYDPIFFLPEYGKTSAELTAAEKNAISHRGKAIRALVQALKEKGIR